MRASALLLAALFPTLAQAGGDTEITPLVQLQLWGTVFDQDASAQADPAGYGDPEHDPGFSLSRARVGFEGHHGALDFQVDLGLSAPYDAVRATEQGGPSLGFVNAFGRGTTELGPGTARVAFGLVRVPFTRERILSSRQLTFQERSVGSTWLGPSQDLGVLLDYELDIGARVQVGVYNGGGDVFGDDNGGVLVAGRLEYARGETYRTYGEADGLDLGVAAAAYYNDDVATDTLGLEADAVVRVWRVSLLAEVVGTTITPTSSTIDLPDVYAKTSRMGITGQLSYWQPMDDSTADAAERSGIEIAARLGTFDDNRALSDNGDVAIVHAGATWRNVTPGVDVGAAFIHREELGGRSLPNDTVRVTGQLRWPIRAVRTTATTPPPRAPDLPSEADLHPPGPK